MWPSVRHLVRIVWLQLTIFVGLALIVELVASLTLRVVPRPQTFDAAFVSTADAYEGASWAQPLLVTLASIRNRWQPYVYWIPEPTTTGELSVEANGQRRTVHPDVGRASDDDYAVAMFGGSTMFGWGARDEFTIPSIVARLAAHHVPGARVRVTNHGRDGYVTNQEVIQLEERLKAGERPHVVVFYDGINDVETAIARQRAGETYEEETLRATTEGRRRLRRQALTTLLTETSTVGVIRALQRARSRPTDLEMRLAATDRDRLADEVVSVYLSNMAHVRRLSVAYGFDVLFYWQPMLYTKTAPTAYERSLFERRWFEDGPPVSSDIYRALWLKVYDRIRATPTRDPAFHDLSRLFDADPAPRFIDPQHLGESGNEIVARRMMDDLVPLLRARAAGS